MAGYAHLPFSKLSDEAIEVAREKNIFFITTLSVAESVARRRFQHNSFLDDPLSADTTPLSDLNEVRKLGHEEVKQQLIRGLLDCEINAKRLKEAGILLAAGTDAPYPGDFQGEGVHHELELLVESGLTPLEAITIATKNAARVVNAKAEVLPSL